jgi:hypothetical protein
MTPRPKALPRPTCSRILQRGSRNKGFKRHLMNRNVRQGKCSPSGIRPIPTGPDTKRTSAPRPTGPEREDDQRLRWSSPWWSPPPESNRRPHPYHGTTRNRCADRRFPRSPVTVEAKGKRSLNAHGCVLSIRCRLVKCPVHCPSPMTHQLLCLRNGRGGHNPARPEPGGTPRSRPAPPPGDRARPAA